MKNLEAVGGSVSVQKLECAANQLIAKVADHAKPPPKPVSANRVSRFLEGHPELVMVTQKCHE
jgi:hypothetical protein